MLKKFALFQFLIVLAAAIVIGRWQPMTLPQRDFIYYAVVISLGVALIFWWETLFAFASVAWFAVRWQDELDEGDQPS